MNESLPRVSIVLPTYNGAKYIRKSVDSCLNQTYKNIELIIVDDASIDETRDIIKSYKDNRIKYIKNEENLGLSKSLNKGFSQSSGEYLTWTSDDNFYSEEAIGLMAEKLNIYKKIDFVYADYYIIDENGNFVRKINVGPIKELDRTNCIGPCFLYRRKIYEKIGDFNPEIVVVEDYEYWLRVREKFRMKRINSYLYYYRQHKESLSNKYGLEITEDINEIIRDGYISLSTKYCLEGEKLYYKNDYSRAKKLFIKSLLLNPFNLYSLRVLSFIFLPPHLAEKIRKIKREILKLFFTKK